MANVLLGTRAAGSGGILDLDLSLVLWLITGEVEEGAIAKSDYRGQFLGLQVTL